MVVVDEVAVEEVEDVGVLEVVEDVELLEEADSVVVVEVDLTIEEEVVDLEETNLALALPLQLAKSPNLMIKHFDF